ncbi:MAG: hypothetical protein QM710_03095 [Flavobacterium sp.]
MKKQLAFFVSLISVTAFSQNNQTYQDNELHRNLDVLNEVSLNKQLKYQPSKTQGSPYLNKMFAPATVSGVSKNAMMRYDAFNDEFEFINAAKDTLVLNKVTPYTNITFTVPNTRYQLLNYNYEGKAHNGYLIWLYEKNNYSLYKKQNIAYVKERIAKSSFDKDTPAHFENKKDTYYLKNGDKEILEFPSGKKELIKLYPEKKNEIEVFLKQNKIDFEKDQDRIKIIDFLSA